MLDCPGDKSVWLYKSVKRRMSNSLDGHFSIYRPMSDVESGKKKKLGGCPECVDFELKQSVHVHVTDSSLFWLDQHGGGKFLAPFQLK